MEEEKTLKEQLSEINMKLDSQKKKPFKLPFKARVSKGRIRNGYVIVQVITDNKNIDFVKEPIVNGTIKLEDTYHAVDDLDIFYYKGKPLVHLPKKRLTSYNPMTLQKPLDGSNETYGQRYVMARMESDKITGKKKFGLGIGIGVLVILGVLAYAFFGGGAG